MFKKQKIKNYWSSSVNLIISNQPNKLMLVLQEGIIVFFAIILFTNHLPLTASVSAQIQKQEITLTWSTDSYIPFDYPAKALPTKGSSIEVVAFLESSDINPEALYYYWYLDERLQRNKSGLGKLTFKFSATNEANRAHRIKLWLKNKEDNLILEKTIEIKIIAPQVYIKGPILMMAEQEKRFTAVPYFFNIKNINELRYNWSIDEKEAQEAEIQNPNILVLKIGQVAKTITKNLKLSIENKNSPQQKTETRLKITLWP